MEQQLQSQQPQQSLVDSILANRFRILAKIGSGSFGDVYSAIDSTNGQEVAVKIDINVDQNSQILHEAKIMKQFQGGEGIPQVYWSGIDETNRQVVTLDLLGANLEQMFIKCGRRFSLKTVLMMIDQMIKRIEFIHSRGFVYRDVKPENFMLGRRGKQQSIIYLIDYGLVKRFKDAKTNKHIQFRANKGLIGTARYVSLNTHNGIEQSRRDDLESLGYLWIYFVKGRLPWQGVSGETKEEKYERLKQKKTAISIDSLCEGLPKQFSTYIQYCRNLKFEQQPDYFYLKQLFKELFFELEYQWDNIFDWMLISDDKENQSDLFKRKNTFNSSLNEDGSIKQIEGIEEKGSKPSIFSTRLSMEISSKKDNQADDQSSIPSKDLFGLNNKQNEICTTEENDKDSKVYNVPQIVPLAASPKLSFASILASKKLSQQCSEPKLNDIQQQQQQQQLQLQQPSIVQETKPTSDSISFNIFKHFPKPAISKPQLSSEESSSELNFFEAQIAKTSSSNNLKNI